MTANKPRMRAGADGALQYTSDGMTNLVSGLGTERDKRSHNYFSYQFMNRRDFFELEAAYSSNSLAKKIVDIPVNDATREWRTFSCDEAREIQQAESYYKLQSTIQEAFKWGRLYGGAIVLMITDQDLRQPLDVERIREGSLKRFVVLDRKHVSGLDFEFTDPTVKNYMLPNYYMIYGGSMQIHHSHVVRIPGEKVPMTIRQNNGGWDDSILRKCMDDVKDAVSAKAGMASLVQEANVDVINREGLSDELSTEDGTEEIQHRYSMAGMLKSINRMLLLDNNETYTRKTIAFGGLGEVQQTLMEWAAGAADIPMTRLFNIQAKGMGDSGQGDMNNYHDSLRGAQQSDYRPCLEQLDEVMLRSWFGYLPDDCEFDFDPLSQPNGNDLAQQDLAAAQADDIRLNNGTIKQSQVMQKLQSEGTYAISDQDINEARRNETEAAQGMFEEPDGDDDDETQPGE